MPTYEYACDKCGHEFEIYQPITAKPMRKCPACNERTLRRLIGTGGGVIFKGSGFYHTDYRSENYKQAAESEKKKSSDAKSQGDGTKPKAEDSGPQKPASDESSSSSAK